MANQIDRSSRGRSEMRRCRNEYAIRVVEGPKLCAGAITHQSRRSKFDVREDPLAHLTAKGSLLENRVRKSADCRNPLAGSRLEVLEFWC